MAESTKLQLILEAIWKGRGIKQAQGDLGKLQKSADLSAGGLKGAGIAAGIAGGLVSVFTGKALQAAGAMKDLAVESALLAARYETMGVVVNNLGENVGMSSTQMRRLERDLEKTGISMLGAREAIAKLVGAEIDLAKATDIARVAQDAAVIAGENSTAAFQRLINFITTGNTRVARQAGLFINLQKAYEDWAKANGRAVGSLTELEKVQIRTTAAIEAGERITGTYTEAMYTAGKQIGSLDRDIENFKVTLGALSTSMMTEAVPATRNLVQGLTDGIQILLDMKDVVSVTGQELERYAHGTLVLADGTRLTAEEFMDLHDAWVIQREDAILAAESFDKAKLALLGIGEVDIGDQVESQFDNAIGVMKDYTREALGAALVNDMLRESMEKGFVSDSTLDRVTSLADRFGVDLPTDLAATISSFNALQAAGIDPATASADDLAGVLLNIDNVTGDLTAREHRIVYDIEVTGDPIPPIPGGYNFSAPSTNTGTTQEDFEAGGGRAVGGRISNAKGIFEVGEAGPEFVIDGVVMPAHVTRQMKRLGLRAGRGFAGGGFAFDVDTIAQITGSSQTAASMSFSQQAALTKKTVEAARSGGGSTTTVGPSGARATSPEAASVAAAVAVEQSVAPVIAQVTSTIEAQQTQLLAKTALQVTQTANLLSAVEELVAVTRAQGTSTDFANDVGDAINEVLG